MTPKRTLDPDIPVYVEQAWLPELRCEYAELPSVQRLAQVLSQSRQMLRAVATFSTGSGRKLGFARDQMRSLRTRVLYLGGRSERLAAAAKSTVDELNAVADDYVAARDNPNLSSAGKAALPGKFTAALAEAVAYEFLVASGRSAGDITRDAHFTVCSEPPSPSNIDLFWGQSAIRAAELYECKNTPRRLLDAYATKDHPGNQRLWEKSQLHLMLAMYKVLTEASWKVYMGCVTLQSRQIADRACRRLGVDPEALALHIHGVEDMGDSFPPPLPN